jgi:phosphopantothenoylcysteine decarboxylase/phosphopantothenate--cysteine ligase
MTSSAPHHRLLLIIGGGIAAYKCLELIRRTRERGIAVRVIMTAAAREFVTPLSVSALTNDRVFTDLFDLDDEREIGHIRLARQSDLVVVAPATADLMAKMAGGHANDLASAVLLATDKPVLLAPAMNPVMWASPATTRNVETLRRDGIAFIGPAAGEMAESGEAGIGRMAEPHEILAAIEEKLGEGGKTADRPLGGVRVLITAGPTHEPIDPVRYIANRSSGRQGYEIAAAAHRLGATVTLVSGPTGLPAPAGVDTVPVESARDMLAVVEASLPADIAIFTAAVADWRVASAGNQKLKKKAGGGPPRLELVENPDILHTIAKLSRKKRPRLVIGFAAETENVVAHATAKRERKGCDWIVANDVSPESGVMGGLDNTVHLIRGADDIDNWPPMTKQDVADRLVREAAAAIAAGKA